MYLLDTNIVSYILKDNQSSKNIRQNLKQKFLVNSQVDLFFSVVSYQEIISGIKEAKRKYGSDYKKDYFTKLISFIANNLIIIDYSKEMAVIYASNYSTLTQMGITPSKFDLMIAAGAIENNFVVITNNTKDFENIPNIKIEDWTKLP